MQIRVAIYEPNEVFRRGVGACLTDDPLIEVVAQAALYRRGDDGAAAPDVAVVSGCLPLAPPCPLVVCVDDRTDGAGPVHDDAFAVLSRSELGPGQLTSAVRAAAVGLRITRPRPAVGSLDARSVAVLRMLAEGAAIREISTALGWSERTIKGVIATLQHEFNSRTRTQTVVEALRRQLI